MKSYETEVLIVGGGGAATASTISAHELGAKTTLAVKGRFGVPGKRGAGATSNPLADFWTIRTVGPKGGLFNPPDSIHRDMVQLGLGMADPKLCRIFVDEVSDAIKRLRSMGMRFGSKMLATMPATEESKGTNNIVQLQKAVIAGTDTRVIEEANLTDLIVENGRVLGAVGIDDRAEPFVIWAGAVILATGGVGQLFTYSFNPPGNTGDGYAMALRAGAQLFNMEFMQQGLATTWPTQAMVMLYEMEDPYRLYDKNGKSFVDEFLPDGVSLKDVSDLKAAHWPVTSRDHAIHLDRAIHQMVIQGRATEHDGVLLDLSSSERGFQPEVFTEYMHKVGIDVKRDLLQVQIHHHTSNGGVRIDEFAKSSIEGLFACGETAGWQGADRVGGTMLGGSQVFGWRAGRAAAEVAKQGELRRVPEDELEALVVEPIRRMKERATSGGHDIRDLTRKLQRAMWERLLVQKDASVLESARRFVREQRDLVDNDLGLRDDFDLVLAVEHKNLLDIAEVIIEAADLRTESRGSHYRTDYPERDDQNWLTNIVVTREEGKLAFEMRRIDENWQDQGEVRLSPWG
jgi:fumarate reductase (CoM/CoB) subunit A